MKKTMVYILALSMAFSMLLAGCGEKQKEQPNPTTTPALTDQPTTMMPDPDDGSVNDDDGIITDNDNGPLDSDDPGRAGVNDLEDDVKKAGDKLENAGDKLMNGGNGSKNP